MLPFLGVLLLRECAAATLEHSKAYIYAVLCGCFAEGSIETASHPMPLTKSESPTLREVLTEVFGAESGVGGEVSDSSSIHEGTSKGVRIAGICPPLDLPVAWLHAVLHAADHFLYISVDL